MERVEVEWRQRPTPIPALRDGIAIAWDFEHPEHHVVPNEGRTLRERNYLLVDVGVKLVNPCWWGESERGTWYVDLVQVEQIGNLYKVRDLYLDLIVPIDGRPYRMLDLDEFGDAIERGAIDLATAVDGLRRWHIFLDKYIHMAGKIDTQVGWSNFPPNKIGHLAGLPASAFDGAERSR